MVEENHLRWDSLGSAHWAKVGLLGGCHRQFQGRRAWRTVDVATQGILDNNKSPARKVGQTDNRDSYYFALYWAEALAAQTDDADIAAHFAPIAKSLSDGQEAILAEMASVQGAPADIADITTQIARNWQKSCVQVRPQTALLANPNCMNIKRRPLGAFLFAQTGQIPQNLHKCIGTNIGGRICQGKTPTRQSDCNGQLIKDPFSNSSITTPRDINQI